MRRCDECKHWDTAPDAYMSEIIPVRKCRKAPQFWDCTEWGGEDQMERVPTAAARDIKMFVQDGSDYSARLMTRADFFCAHFEGV